MCPCSPVSFPSPSGPTGPAIPPYGVPFTLPNPNIPFPDGFPEDLLDLLNKLQMLIPPGALKPALNPNFGKDVFDGIMKLLDQFMPFLMLYKFFLPILRLIICIIEVLCALMNPFALISALNRLFTQCIPEFLNLFPIFALILMIISLLLLLLALIIYIIQQILKLIRAILRNLNALIKAFQLANATVVINVAKKLGALLCIFQNLFVLLSLFGIIIQIIKDILSLLFSIPPCEGGGPGSTDGCCAATYCPTIVQGEYKRQTGILKYLPQVTFQTSLGLLPGSFFNVDVRTESWQIYDTAQTQEQEFWNIVNAFDVSPTIQPKPVYFPTDAVYNATTPPRQAAYTMDLRLYYNPVNWGRVGNPQFIRFKDCIVVAAPTQTVKNYDNGNSAINSGVFNLVGGKGFLDDGTTVLTGFAPNGIDPIGDQATLENFLHTAPRTNGQLNSTDGYFFLDMEYTFKPNHAVLLQKNLINARCMPEIANTAAFMSNVMFSQVGFQAADLADAVNGRNGHVFPDPNAAVECLLTATANLRSNMTFEGVAEFQATCDTCLNKLTEDANAAIKDIIGIGFSPCKSTFSVNPSTQFTTEPITVTVNLNENNGLPLTGGLPTDIAASLADNIKGTVTFGTISRFTYDGYQAFNAILTHDQPGDGEIMIAFKNQVLCTDTLPTIGNPYDTASFIPPSHDLQTQAYHFVYAPSVNNNIPTTGEGDTTGTQPRRDAGDQSRDNNSGGGNS